MPKQGKRNTKSNARRKKTPPVEQANNGAAKVTRTSIGMTAKAPAGTVRQYRLNRVRAS